MIKIKIKNKGLNLHYTLDSGQIFRWQTLTDGNSGFIKNNPVKIYKNNDELIVLPEEPDCSGLTRAAIKDFFDLNSDYDEIIREINDPLISRLYERYRGARILKQEPLECAVSFITSANNNIKRINNLLQKLSDFCSENTDGMSKFPDIDQLSKVTERDFKDLGFGYRAEYLYKFIQGINMSGTRFYNLANTDYTSAKEYLCSFKGIGNKVADCILLYGFKHREAFPVDVWIKRALKKYYPSEKAVLDFGKYAGIAQLYLFLDIRGIE